MKKLLSFIACIGAVTAVYSQGVTVGSNNPPDASAVLDVQSTNGGMLLPRMTTTQRNAIANPATGLTVINTTTNCIEMYFPLSGWQPVRCDCQIPSAVFSASPSSPYMGAQVTFTPATPGLTYQWTFQGGNPASSTQQSPVVSWNTNGTYNVTLIISDGGCSDTVTNTITVSGVPRNCLSYKLSNPNLPSGIYSVDPDSVGGNAPFNCYCDMTTDGGGWASIFTLNGNLTLTNNTCIMSYSNDDHDSYIMWADLEMKVSNTNSSSTNITAWFRQQRNGSAIMTPAALPNQPNTVPGSEARPVPLPGSGKVIWIDWQNSRILWGNSVVAYSSISLTWATNLSYSTNTYFVSDGVDMIVVGQGSNATLLRFNFFNNTVTGTPVTSFAPSNFFGTEEDSFNNMLYTVNGKIFHYNGSGNFRMAGVMGGGNPNTTTATYPVTWPLGYDTQHGLDFFGYVDNNNALWFADWGHDNGGYFNCGNDSGMGVGLTNIMLTY